MPALFFRYLFNIFCCIYTYHKIINTNKFNKLSVLGDSTFSLCLALVMTLLSTNNSSINITITLVISALYISLSTKTKLIFTFVATLLSLSISIIALAISSIFIGLLMITCFSDNPFISMWSIIAVGLVQLLIVISIFKSNRLRTGMPFLYNKSRITLGFSLSLIIVIVFLLFQHIILTPYLPRLILLLSFLSIAFLLIHWWKRKITQEYVEKLRLEDWENMQKKISARDQKIEELKTDNDNLGNIIHKDNKLIPAMEYAVCNYLQTVSEMNEEEVKQQGSDLILQLQQSGADLLLQLQQVAAEREGILNAYEKNSNKHPEIGIASIDAVIQYMERRAVESGIRYKMQFDPELKENILKHVEEHDVLHLLSDLIENAIIAAVHNEKKEIRIHLGFSYDNLFFDIYDSGVPFTTETYQNFGNQRYTTYADSGGSGIGLTDIWKLKRKYKASLQIYEYASEEDPFTKKIRILFDRKNHFLIQTYRVKEIRSNIIRSDLHVFPYGEYSLSESTEESSAI